MRDRFFLTRALLLWALLAAPVSTAASDPEDRWEPAAHECAAWLLYASALPQVAPTGLQPLAGALLERFPFARPQTPSGGDLDRLATVFDNEWEAVVRQNSSEARVFFGTSAIRYLEDVSIAARILWAAQTARGQHSAERRWQRAEVRRSERRVVQGMAVGAVTLLASFTAALVPFFWSDAARYLPPMNSVLYGFLGALPIPAATWQYSLWRDRRRARQASRAVLQRYIGLASGQRQRSEPDRLREMLSDRAIPFSIHVGPFQSESSTTKIFGAVGLVPSETPGELEPFVLLVPVL